MNNISEVISAKQERFKHETEQRLKEIKYSLQFINQDIDWLFENDWYLTGENAHDLKLIKQAINGLELRENKNA